MPRIFIPLAVNNSVVVGESSPTDVLFRSIAESPLQQRKIILRHPLLELAAQNKADDMTAKRYYSHTSPSGVSANANIRSTGYVLPDWYPIDKNNCESWGLGHKDTELETIAQVMGLWTSSSDHNMHIFGTTDFYRGQECVGVGISKTFDGSYIFVFLSAPPL